jgi:hypothetical protein
MSEFKLFDNGFLILKEDNSFSSPIATLFYEKYASLKQLQEKLKIEKDNLQCIVSQNLEKDHIFFGETQHPGLSDYADKVNTLDFLSNL